MKQTLRRHKNKTYPKDPGTVEGIREQFLKEDILKEFGSNFEGDEDFYKDTVVEKDFAFTIFASKYVIDFIQTDVTKLSDYHYAPVIHYGPLQTALSMYKYIFQILR